MLTVTHNIAAMNAQRQFGVNTNSKTKSMEKLSSGFKINRAADDAAALSISEKMRKQVRGLSKGVENAEAGVSLCQVMDGALQEVTEMTQRISELSIQAANGTNSAYDRQLIQNEINEIIQEINRVGETTKFNEIYPFKVNGYTSQITKAADGESEADIPFSDFKLSDISLGMNPFTASSGANHLALQAIVDNPDSSFNGKTYNLIFGNGSTSSSSFQLSYNGKTTTVAMSSFSSPVSYSYDAANRTWNRTYNYTNADGIDLDFTQIVKVVDTSDTEKNYQISYQFKNNNPSTDISVNFMFHADTAYNNNDTCEGYFMNGTRVENTCLYTSNNSILTNGQNSSYIYNNMPNSFSIVDENEALAFSEKISFTTANAPYALSIGRYNNINNWSYYNNLNSNLGLNTTNMDLGFSLFYSGTIGGSSSTVSFDFNYGIASTVQDNNITGVTPKKDTSIVRIPHLQDNLWIQSGADALDGMSISLRPINAEILKLDDVNVLTEEGADTAMDLAKEALQYISSHRSSIGAQQNRLEHTIKNEENTVENTTAAESQIRDTDLAKEMVNFSKANILEQVGQSFIAQANQSTQSVLHLLQ